MKKIIGLFALPLVFGALLGVNFIKHYKPGDYVPEENAYFGGEAPLEGSETKAHKFVVPTDNQYSTQKERAYGTNKMGDIESVWNSYTGAGTTIAIIDDGFDYNHPEYRRADNSSAISNKSRYYYHSGNYYYYEEYSSDPSCIAEDWYAKGNEWDTHGTATSTTAAAPMNNGGGVGIAPEAEILALKVDMYLPSIYGALEYAISQHVDAINMSLGWFGEDVTDGFGEEWEGDASEANYLESLCQQAYNQGIIVVASAGNEATYYKSYPACNYKVVGVGALGNYYDKGNMEKLAEFTNFVHPSQTGEVNVDILASGYVWTAHQQGTQDSITHTYDDIQGTSFSSPIVAGAACLWKQKNPNGTPDQFLQELQSTADGIGYYTDKMVPAGEWDGVSPDAGPSNITQGRLNVAKLLGIDEPFVSLKQSEIYITKSESKQIELQTYNGTITYSSNNTAVATVSNSGLIEAVSEGTATITVTATKNGHTTTATVSVTVLPIVNATAIEFDPNEITLNVGETYDAEGIISVTPSNASRVFMFESKNENVATVDDETGLVTAVAPGAAEIYATAIYGSGEDTLTVTVNAEPTYTWDRIESTSGLVFGAEYVLGCYSKGKVSGQLSGSYLTAVDATFASATRLSSLPSGTETFTLGTSSNKYTLTQKSNGQLLGYTAKNLNSGSGTTTWSISISSGICDITGGSYVLAYNADSPRWKTYDSNFAGTDYSLYKKTANSGGSISVASVSVSPTSLNLTTGQSSTLTATVLPSDATNKNVTWTSSNTGVATVSNGTVTAVAAGNATITVKTVDGNKTATCSVTVSAPKTLSSISITGQKTTFTVGDSFSFGGTVTAHFSDSTTANVTNSASFSGYNMSVAGNYIVTVSYTYGGTTKTATYQITVNSGSQAQTSYYEKITDTSELEDGTYLIVNSSSGRAFNGNATSFGTAGDYVSVSVSNNKIAESAAINNATVTYNSADHTLKTHSNYYIGQTSNSNGINSSTSTKYTNNITFSNGNAIITSSGGPTLQYYNATNSETFKYYKSNQQPVQLYKYIDPSRPDKVLDSISATYSGGDVFVGGSLDTSKITVTAHYTEPSYYSDKVVTGWTTSGFSSASVGVSQVTISYTENTVTKQTTIDVNIIEDTLQSISATCSKTFHPGETISKSDIVVTGIFLSGNKTITDFSFANDGYQFTYEDAPSGGTNGTKQFSITYGGKSCNFNVNVTRVAYQTVSGSTTTLSSSQFGSSDLSKSIDTASNTSVTIGGVGFTVTTNAYVFNTNSTNYISFGKTAGSIKNANAFSNDLASVTITQKSGARQDGVLTISKNGIDWVSYSAAEIAKGGYRYFKYEYVGSGSGSGASQYSNIQTISYTLSGQDNPTNVANYIMYEDTNGQCLTKLDLAIDKLNTMSSADKSTFWTSNDYVIATARERLEAWVRHEGKTLNYTDGSFVINSNNMTMKQLSNESAAALIIILSLVSVSLLGGYLLIKKKKEQ